MIARITMEPTRLLALALLCVAPRSLPAQSPRRASRAVAPSGFAPARLARIDRFMQQYVDSGEIGGAVGLVLKDGRVVYQHAVGWLDKESGRRMTTDALFRIASQTKAVTTVAVLSLIEEGSLAAGDPVSRYIPAFAHTTVGTKSDTGLVTKPAARPITIRDLLTHTAGISYGTDGPAAPLYVANGLGTAAGWGWYTADKDEPICTTMERLATLPFAAQPGERWVYGYNTDILGCVAERASGMPLDDLIRTRITGPLKMNDTYFFVPQGASGRLATVYASDSTNHAQRAPDGPRGQGNYVDGPRRSFSGGAGLISTAGDYARFLEMLRNGGELGGVRILAPHTV
ncbi:MAG: serine hydrolase, partial [Gemmatimonadetes bacterium]